MRTPLRLAHLAVAASLVVSGCAPIYGADFDYPEEPAVPEGAEVVVTDAGKDDDDPMRTRIAVVDPGDASMRDLRDFYHRAYSADAGWRDMEVAGGSQTLCLVRSTDEGYADYLEVFRYEGSRVVARPGRVLVMRSRTGDVEPDAERRTCGLARAWLPYDLLRASRGS